MFIFFKLLCDRVSLQSTRAKATRSWQPQLKLTGAGRCRQCSGPFWVKSTRGRSRGKLVLFWLRYLQFTVLSMQTLYLASISFLSSWIKKKQSSDDGFVHGSKTVCCCSLQEFLLHLAISISSVLSRSLYFQPGALISCPLPTRSVRHEGWTRSRTVCHALGFCQIGRYMYLSI